MALARPPAPRTEFEHAEVAFHRNRAKLAITSDSTVAVAYMLQPRIVFHSITGDVISRRDRGSHLETKVKALQGSRGQVHVVPEAQTRYDYLDLAVTTQALLALYSGRTEASHGPAAALGRTLEVFSPQGMLLGAVLVASDLMAIEVDEERSLLYGLGSAPDEQSDRAYLYVFSLTSIVGIGSPHPPPNSRIHRQR